MTGAAESALLLFGSLLMLLAAVGILRMPDLYTRLQVTSKASVLGVVLFLGAATIHFAETAVTVRAAIIIAFFILTVPVSTHMLARAGYTTGVPFSPETVVNELTARYDPASHTLAGDEPIECEYVIRPGSPAAGRRIAELRLPQGTLLMTIRRAERTVIPGGPTVLEEGDVLRVLAQAEHLGAVGTLFEPVARPPTEPQVERADD